MSTTDNEDGLPSDWGTLSDDERARVLHQGRPTLVRCPACKGNGLVPFDELRAWRRVQTTKKENPMYPNTSDLDDDFFPRLQDVGDAVLAKPLDLAKVMFSESGLHHDAWNDNPKSLPPPKRYNASGINQMMPATLQQLGWSAGHAAYRALSATQELTWVERYFRPYRGMLDSVGAIYTANFLPVLVPRAGDPDFVLTAKNGVMGWAYGPNATFDANGDARITVGELEAAVERNCSGPRWAEIVKRLTGEDVSPELSNFDLGTVQGFQSALDRLGYDVGAVDGIPGQKTHDALFQFQAQHDLKADGVYGPLTRAALQTALDTAA